MDKEDSQRDGSTQQDRGHILLLTLRLGLRVLLRGAELEHDLRGPRRVGLHLVPERAGQAEVRPSGGVARVHGQLLRLCLFQLRGHFLDVALSLTEKIARLFCLHFQFFIF